MHHTADITHLIWLDPFRPLSEDERARLQASGLVALPVATLDEMRDQLAQADMLVLRLEGNLELLREAQAVLKAQDSQLPIVCRIERRQLELAVAAMQQGARHVLAHDDFSAGAWQAALPPSKETPAPAAVRPQAPRTVVYVDPASRHLLALTQRVARAPVSVLIEGPTGAGKEVLARVLHEASNRARAPFVALNCAALPDHLIEDMLFGHEKGAFTGAVKEHRGLFEQAQGGTIFLDEIAEMPLHLQAKLLRVLQEKQLVRLGGERALELDVRVVAATNRDLRAATASREFREDLYFRLSTFKLRVPPLRERPGDILPLVARLLVRHAEGGRVLGLSAQAQARLQAHSWPGNVRELENVVLRALVLCMGEVIQPEHLMFDEVPHAEVAVVPGTAVDAFTPPREAEPATAPTLPTHLSMPPSTNPSTPFHSPASFAAMPPDDLPDAREPASLQQAVQMSEQQLIVAALQSTYSRMDAARKLGISPRTLRYKLAKLRDSGAALPV